MLVTKECKHLIYKRLPAVVDPRKRYVFYLHGKIIEDQGEHAQHPSYGVYEYNRILETIRDSGFHVISETRSRDTDILTYAKKIAEDIKDLIRAWVPQQHITILAASKGALIAGLVSALLKKDHINYVLLSFAKEETYDRFKSQGLHLTGNVLSIYEASDKVARSCSQFKENAPALNRFHEIELNIGIGHQFLYEPRPEWLSPALSWAKGAYADVYEHSQYDGVAIGK